MEKLSWVQAFTSLLPDSRINVASSLKLLTPGHSHQDGCHSQTMSHNKPLLLEAAFVRYFATPTRKVTTSPYYWRSPDRRCAVLPSLNAQSSKIKDIIMSCATVVNGFLWVYDYKWPKSLSPFWIIQIALLF